jgi:hypothetical protein
MTVTIKVLRDKVPATDPSGPVPVGTIIRGASIRETSFVQEPGEAWYLRPDTNEPWYSLPGDYALVFEEEAS